MAVDRRFSIQKHEALEIHYILNLETREGIVSFAIPGGPSQDPRLKRLAFPVKNAIDIDFEGLDLNNSFVGAKKRRVIVWDSGHYNTAELDGKRLSATESLKAGRLEFTLHGSKIKGGFSLLRVEKGPNERWFMIKTIDSDATSMRDPVHDQPQSVVSGRNLEQLTAEFPKVSRDDL